MTARIALVLAVMMVPVILLQVYLSLMRGEEERRRVEGLAIAMAASTSHDVADLLDLARRQVDGLAAAEKIDGASCDGARLTQAVHQLAVLRGAYVANAAGDILCSSQPLVRTINVADRDYVRRTFAGPAPSVSGALQSRNSGEWTVVLSRPLAGAAHGMFGSLDLGWIQRALDNHHLPPGGLISLVDRDGRIVARHPHVAAFIGRKVADGPPAMPGAKAVEQKTSLAGVPTIIASSRVPGYDFTVRVGLPATSVGSAVQNLLAGSLLVTALSFLAALGFGTFTLQRLVGAPMRKLIDAAARMGRGDLAARTGLAHDEALTGQLARKLDELAGHAQRVNRALFTLSGGNRTLLRERNEASLLAAMCRNAVERGGYPAAYVCYPRHDEARSIDVMAQHGEDGGFISTVPLTWADTLNGQGSIGRCLRSGERSIIRSIAEDALTGPWRGAAAGQGFGSVISLPLRVHGVLAGTFTLVAREPDAFDDDEVALLDEMAADLSFGIQVIRAEARRQEAEALAKLALTQDSIVPVSNRQTLVRAIDALLATAQAANEPVAVLDVHLGTLQDIIDSLGYEHGNTVLREVGRRLQALPECAEGLGRVPADDFGIVLRGRDAASAAAAARRILAALAEPFALGEASVHIGAAIGASFFPGHGQDGDALLRRAAVAARLAFRREAGFLVYAGASARENPDRLALASELRGAIERKELELHYQPKVRLGDGVLVGCEALVRWRHPTRGLLPPAQFIALAEETGLIRPLTYEIIDLAVRQQRAWGSAGSSVPVAINLSARNLYDPRLHEVLDGVFATWGVARELLHFEITESALVDDPAAARQVLTRMRGWGANLFIDDFGTGYSSLSYLVSLPVQALKIDRSFIVQMARSQQARSVVASIVSMAHGLGLKVVAEGVEDGADLDVLQALGCDEAQGYFYAKPLPAAEFDAWRRQRA